MKKFGKILAVVASIALCLSMGLGLVACGETPKATITHVYSANKDNLTDANGMNVANSLTVTLYSDNTYMLCDESYTISSTSGNEFGHFNSMSWGTFTQETVDEKTITLKLSKPTSIIYNACIYGGAMGTYYYNTDDAATFEVEDGEEATVTAETLLNAAKELTLTVDIKINRITDGAAAGSVCSGFFSATGGGQK